MDAKLIVMSYDHPVKIMILTGEPPLDSQLPTTHITSKLGHLETLEDLLFAIRIHRHTDGMPIFEGMDRWSLIDDITRVTVGVQGDDGVFLSQPEVLINPYTRVDMKIWEPKTIKEIVKSTAQGLRFVTIVFVHLSRAKGDFYTTFLEERTKHWQSGLEQDRSAANMEKTGERTA